MAGEQIKVVLEADSAKFEAAMKRASSIAQKFETDLQKQNAGRTSGVGLPGLDLTPQSLRQLETASARAKELARQTAAAGSSGKAGALGFLAFSQAVEDAQYGMKGVLNNIPQMILGFGGGAGLAGALSLAAVAGVALYPVLKDLYGVADNEELAKRTEEWSEIFNKGMQAAAAIEKAGRDERLAAGYAAEYNQALADRLSMMSQLGGFYDAELEAQRATRAAAAEIASAREKLVSGGGGDTKAAIIARQQAELKGIDQDLANRQAERARLNSEIQDLAERRSGTATGIKEQENALLAQQADLLRNIAALEADLKSAESAKTTLQGKGNPYVSGALDLLSPLSGLPGMKFTGAGVVKDIYQKGRDADLAALKNEMENIANLAPRLAAAKEQLAEVEARLGAAKNSGSAEELRNADQVISANTEKLNTVNKEIAALEALKALRASLNQLERQAVALEDAKANLAELKARQPDLEKAAEKAAATAAAVDAMVKEMDLTDEAIQQGGKKLTQLEDELAIRKEINRLIGLGMTPEKASNLARDQAAQKQELQKALKDAQLKALPVGERAAAIRDANKERRAQERVDAQNAARAKRAEDKAKRLEQEAERFPNGKVAKGLEEQKKREQINKEQQEKAKAAEKARDKNLEDQANDVKKIRQWAEKVGAA